MSHHDPSQLLGLTPYDAASHCENRKMTNFFLDVLFFNFFPYWTPSFVVASIWTGLYLFLYYFPLIQALIFTSILYCLGIYSPLIQRNIIDHIDRRSVGSIMGVILCYCHSYLTDLRPFVSSLYNLVCLTAFLGEYLSLSLSLSLYIYIYLSLSIYLSIYLSSSLHYLSISL